MLIINSPAQTRFSKKKIKEEKDKKEYTAITKLIKSKSFLFEAENIHPMNANFINVQGEGNYLKVANDSINSYLPFFGVLHSSTGYNNRGSIEINNNIENYKVYFNDSKKKISIKFRGKKNSETFDMILEVFNSGSATLTLMGSYRSSIRYNGRVLTTN